MTVNPFESPTTLQTETPRQTCAVVSYLVTSVTAGALAGAGATFAYSFFFVAPIWGPTMYKGDERWESIFFIASTLLPLSIITLIVLALVGFCFISYRMRHRHILISCFVLWILISANRPVISRVRRPEIPSPKFETIPDTLLIIVCSLFVVTFVSVVIQWLLRRSRNNSAE